jgi:hypothetical protein
MRNMKAILALAALLATLLPTISLSAEADLSGTWVGSTQVPDRSEPDRITLILKKEAGEYEGTVSDSLGLLKETAIEDIEFEDNELNLSLTITVSDGSEPKEVEAELVLEKGRLKGSWFIEDGPQGDIVLEKIK